VNIKYLVELTADERIQLLDITAKGRQPARVVKRANILLMADGWQHSDSEISDALSAGTSTVFRVKRDFVEYGLEVALSESDRPGGARKLDANEEALLVSIACSKPPKGSSRWTLQLLTDKLVTLTPHEQISRETVRRRLQEKELKPWQKKMWCIPKLDADFVAQMEHILDLYAEPSNPAKPVVNFDEALKQLVADTRKSKPMRPGQPAKQDYEYRRVGNANIFLFFDRHRGWRKAKPTETKGNLDFAECMRDLVDIHYPNAEMIRLVLDNLNTHRPAALYRAFPPEEARRILRRIEFHYTPKHASWLNMVEIEIGNMNQQCLDRRIPNWHTLTEDLSAWEKRRNEEKASIKWMFDVDKARNKLTRAYQGLNQS
jgi:DDE superfamily endonuclease/Homeodomain-like domain